MRAILHISGLGANNGSKTENLKICDRVKLSAFKMISWSQLYLILVSFRPIFLLWGLRWAVLRAWTQNHPSSCWYMPRPSPQPIGEHRVIEIERTDPPPPPLKIPIQGITWSFDILETLKISQICLLSSDKFMTFDVKAKKLLNHNAFLRRLKNMVNFPENSLQKYFLILTENHTSE